ncbi:MAG: Fur family transcriptional regulator [Pseudomonadota bacterium]
MPRQRSNMQEALLAVLRQHEQPQSAYALLAALRTDNAKLAPTTIYRALDALSEQGMVHRIESLNAYACCRHGDHTSDCIMAICDDCGIVEEQLAPKLIGAISAETEKSGFAPKRHVVEVHGSCAACGSTEDRK